MLLLFQPIRHDSKAFLKGRIQDQAARSNWLETRDSSTKAPKSPRNQWKQLHSFKKNKTPIFSRISFPPEHFVTVIVTRNLFFSSPCLFCVFSSTERTVHCFANGQQSLSPDRGQPLLLTCCSARLGWALLSNPAEAASQQREHGWTQQATMSRHVRTQKGNGWA